MGVLFFYLNHKAHEEHKGKALLSVLRVLRGSNFKSLNLYQSRCLRGFQA